MKVNGAEFKKMRENRLLGPYNLAKLAGISPSIIKSIENGGSPRLESIRKVLAALDLTVEEAYQKRMLEE
ncbi:MAG: helix-turn-helix domain-containing protein [Deltaproteobacteria bacterium]|jgi:predicted transcriptional regulator|nr:helix-turn-helix domain-containing protein [Deltaproteobacteria bacterium]